MDKIRFVSDVYNNPKYRAKYYIPNYEPSDKVINQLLSSIPQDCEYVIRARYSEDKPTLESIGHHFPTYLKENKHSKIKGVSRQRIKQILDKAHKRLKHPTKQKILFNVENKLFAKKCMSNIELPSA